MLIIATILLPWIPFVSPDKITIYIYLRQGGGVKLKKIGFTMLTILALVLVLAAILSACSSSSSEDATTTFCQSIQSLVSAEANDKSIDASTTIGQDEQYTQDLKQA